MKVLLDVNALLAWAHANSPHHEAFHAWVATHEDLRLWTCALTELGFIRVSMQVFGYDRKSANQALQRLKRSTAGFIPQAPTPQLPVWAKTAAQTTDAYLVQLAHKNDLQFATFDRKIKDHTAVQIAI